MYSSMCSMCSGSIYIIVGFLFCIIFFIIRETKIDRDIDIDIDIDRDRDIDIDRDRDEVSRLKEEKRWLVRYIHSLDKKVEENWKLERYIKYLERKVDILERKNNK